MSNIGEVDGQQRRFPLWYHPLYTEGIHPEARFPRDRYELLRLRLIDSDIFETMTFRTPGALEKNLLLLAHSSDYVHRFLAGELTVKEEKRIGLTPWTPDMIQRTLRLTGGAVEATEYAVMNGGISGNMAGGTHHAHRDFGSGYCVFNDLAISALYAVHRLNVERVAVLDLDVHQGDGTATILSDESRVCTISVHCETNFPFRKSTSDHDLPVAAQGGDVAYLEKVQEALDICMDFEPSLVLFQAGVDGLEADALGKLSVSRAGMKERNRLVFEAAQARQIPVVIFMGGGYAKPIEATLEAFVDLFTAAAKWNQTYPTGSP